MTMVQASRASISAHAVPANEQELAELVRDAAREGRSVRAVGSRHSVAAAYQTDDLTISLAHLSDVLSIDGRRVRFQAGRILGDLCRTMDAAGLALANLGGITAQTVAGFLATGSHGGSSRHSSGPNLRSLRLLTASGEFVDLDRSHPWFPAAAVSMGLLGIVVEASFDAEPRYGVEGTEEGRPFEEIVDEFPRWSSECDYLRVLWYPGIGRGEVWRGHRCEVPEKTRLVRRMSPLYQHVANGAAFLGTRARPLLARSIWRTVASRGRRAFQGPWHEVLPQDEGLEFRRLPHTYCELWIPEEHGREAMLALAEYFEAEGLCSIPALPVEFYCAPANQSWMSPGYERASLRINLIHYDRDPIPAEQMFHGPCEILRAFDPRAHWGKYQPRTQGGDPVSSPLPRLEDFLQLRAKLDPEGTFLTPYWRRVMRPLLKSVDWPASPYGRRR